MTLTDKARLASVALIFGFLGLFALGLSTGNATRAGWLAEVAARNLDGTLETAPRAVSACDVAPAPAEAESEA